MMLSRTLLITGVGIDGIGLEICRKILSTQKVAREPINWTLILGQRDPGAPQSKTAEEILKKLCTNIQCVVKSYSCDLADFASVRRFAEEVRLAHKFVDIVVLNASTIVESCILTADQNESIYQINHLGHFLLLHLLRDVVRERVVFVSSSLHKKADAQATIDSLGSRSGENFDGMKRYGQSKLLDAYCLSHWHNIFASRKVKVVLGSPGFVPSSRLSRYNPFFAKFAMAWIIHYLPFARSLSQAGTTIAALAIADEYSNFDNIYVDANLKPEPMHSSAYDTAQSKIVWEWSRRLCSVGNNGQGDD